MSSLLLLSLLAGGPQIAANPGVPYRVTGVGDWDTLLIRSRPSAKAAIRGAIPHDGVEVSVLKFGTEKRWAYVNYHDMVGWVSTAYLSPAAEVGAPQKGVSCTGTEPFWSLTLAGVESRWASPEGDEAAPLSEPIAASNRTNGWMLSGDGAVRWALLEIDPGCSDGMSEKAWDYSAWILHSDGRLLQGCCSVK